MPCEAFIPDIVDAACGELPAERRPAFESHLSGCEACRRELTETSGTTELLVRTRDEPDDLLLSGFALRTALAAEARRDRAWWKRPRAQLSALLAVATCAAAVLVIAPQTGPVSPASPLPVSAGEASYSLWEFYGGDEESIFAELSGESMVFTLDDALSGMSEEDLGELVEMLDNAG